MDRPFLRPSNSSSAMEIEDSSENSSREMAEPFQPASRFAELQLRREKRRTSENRAATSMDPESADNRLKPCDFCHQLIIITIYDQHILECARQNRDQSHDTKNQEEAELPNQMEAEANELQVARPDNQSEQDAPENFFNLFGRFRNPRSNF